MAINAAKEYVVPAGTGFMSGVFGGGDRSGEFQTAPAGGFFGENPYAPVNAAWNWQTHGLGVLPGSDALYAGLAESAQRYGGNGQVNPATGLPQGGWSDRWQQWFGTGGIDPRSGEQMLSPYQTTGLRTGQDYGARDAQGNALSPANNDIFQGFTWTQNRLAQNPYLDPTQALGGYNAAMTGSPFAAPRPGEYTSAVRSAAGGPGDTDRFGQRGLGQVQDLAGQTDFDQYGLRGLGQVQGLAGQTDFDRYGLRGIDQTNALATQNLNALMSGIDTESQRTLATQLPEIAHAMEAAGLGRSGAGQQAMLQRQGDILSQANRDKQRTLADFQTQTLGRQADAINLATQQGFAGQGQKYSSVVDAMLQAAQLGFAGQGQEFGALTGAMNLGSQLGAQGQESYANRMGNAALAGLGDQFAMNEANRAGARSLWQQGMDQQNQRYIADSGNYLNALTGGGQYALSALEQERLGQSSALADYMNLVNQREDWRSRSLGEYLGLGDQERGIRQDRVNQQLASMMTPADWMMRMATGTTAPAGPQGGQTSFWNQMGGQALGGAASALGQGVGGWFGDWMGNNTPGATR